MEAFWAMRKRQKENAEKAKIEMEKAAVSVSEMVVEGSDLPNIEEGNEAAKVPQRMRGKTRMDKVHTRSFDKRVFIGMNSSFQPVAESDKVQSELSSFLVTLAKRCVSLTYVTWRHVPKDLKVTLWNYMKARYVIPDELEKWVIETIHASWKGYKSRVKAYHFTTFENDELRLQNRPDDILLLRFKILLEYWNDESVQEKAMKNSVARKAYFDTHTLGPKGFAQHRNKPKKKAPNQLEPCDGEIFLTNSKSVEGRKYKTNPEIVKGKIEKISDKLIAGDDLLSDKKHGPNWLLGRCVKPSKICTPAPTDSYVKELTSRISQELAAEVEEQVKQIQADVDDQVNRKVQQNMAAFLKRLGEANPNITIDVSDLCTNITSENEHDNGTPITGCFRF